MIYIYICTSYDLSLSYTRVCTYTFKDNHTVDSRVTMRSRPSGIQFSFFCTAFWLWRCWICQQFPSTKTGWPHQVPSHRARTSRSPRRRYWRIPSAFKRQWRRTTWGATLRQCIGWWNMVKPHEKMPGSTIKPWHVGWESTSEIIGSLRNQWKLLNELWSHQTIVLRDPIQKMSWVTEALHTMRGSLSTEQLYITRLLLRWFCFVGWWFPYCSFSIPGWWLTKTKSFWNEPNYRVVNIAISGCSSQASPHQSQWPMSAEDQAYQVARSQGKGAWGKRGSDWKSHSLGPPGPCGAWWLHWDCDAHPVGVPSWQKAQVP